MRMKQIIGVLLISITATINSFAQDNNQSLQEGMKNIWNNNSDNIYPIEEALDINNDPPPTFDDNAVDAPIDGGLGFLLAAGVGLGARRLRKRKQEQKNRK
jgi:hypothetical protein